MSNNDEILPKASSPRGEAAKKSPAQSESKRSLNRKKSRRLRAKTKRSRRRRIFRAIVFAFIFLLLFVFIALIVLWFNRMMVIEEGLKRVLKSRGYDAEFILENATDTQASLRDISISYDGEAFFSADHLAVTYGWDNLRYGRFDSVRVDAPTLKLDIDENGDFTSAWLPEPSSDNSAGFVFPKDGVIIRDASLETQTPYGALTLGGTVFAESLGQFSAQITAQPTMLLGYRADDSEVRVELEQFDLELTRDDDQFLIDKFISSVPSLRINALALDALNLSVSGAVDTAQTLELGAFDFSGEAIASLGAFTLPYNAETLSGRDLSLNFDGDAGLRGLGGAGAAGSGLRYEYDGTTQLSGVAIDSAAVKLGASQVAISGRLSGETASDVSSASHIAQLNFDTSFDGVGVKGASTRQSIARRVTLAKTLETLPVAEYFSGSFTQDVAALLSGFSVDAVGQYVNAPEGHSLTLSAPVTLRSSQIPSQGVTLTQSGKTLLFYNRVTELLTVSTDVDIVGDKDLNISALTLSGPSETGWLWTSVSSVKAAIRSSERWVSGAASLDPFAADIDYNVRSGGNDLAVQTTLNYSGALLGYDLTELSANGRLIVSTQGDTLKLGFESASPLSIKKIKTPLGWDAQDLTFTLSPDAGRQDAIVRRREDELEVDMQVSEFRGQIIRSDQVQDMVLTASRARIQAMIEPNRLKLDTVFTDSFITSDTLPGKGTKFKSPQLSLGVDQGQDGVMKLDVSAQSADALIKPLTLRGVNLSATGPIDDLTINYSKGKALMSGIALPAIPVNGSAKMVNGVIEGEAKTALPQAPRFPAYLTYRYADGRAEARVNVPEFIFSPGGIQPQSLAPVLRGKIAEVTGLASAVVDVVYIAGQPLQTRAEIAATNMDIGTLVGPFSGVNTVLKFDSLSPLRTQGVQTIKMDGFDPGLPLPAGSIDFSVIEGGINISRAEWQIESGVISVRPTIWSTTGKQNRVIVDIKDVSLGELIAELGNEDLSVTGQINGELPIYVDGVTVKVDAGRLEIADGGIVSFKSKGLDLAGERNETANLAAKALKNFHYESLSLDINGPLGGDIKLGAVFTGYNPNVLWGTRFKFNTTVEGELVNIARSLSKYVDYQQYLEKLESETR